MAASSVSSRPSQARELVDPRDGSVHDDYVHAGWENLTPGKRYGLAVPRVWTPPLRELTPETSWGFRVIDFARDVLELDLMPWQRWLLIHMLELGRDGRLRFQTAVILVARQNGKSTLSQVLSLWFMIEAKWPLVLGTAQDLTTAEEVWEGAVGILEDDPELTTLIAKLSQRNGKKMVTLTNMTRYLVKAASRKAGRGLSGNLILLDELREQQNWAAWGAITKTTNAQVDSLIVGLSNAGDITSVVLRYLRLMAHLAVGDPDGLNRDSLAMPAAAPTVAEVDPDEGEDEGDALDELEQDEDTLFLAEWSAIPGVAVRDRTGWQQANPALGHRIQEKKIAGDSRTDPEWVFRTEVLCQWSDSVLEGPFPPGSWELGQNLPLCERDDDGKPILDDDGRPYFILDENGRPQVADEDRIVGDYDVAIDQSGDRSMAYITAVGRRADGVLQAEVLTGRAGTDWVRDYLMDRKARIRRVTGQWRGAPISLFMQDLEKDPKCTLEIVPWQGGDLMGATGLLFDHVRDVTIRHNKQPPLDVAAGTAVMKKLGDGNVIDRHASDSDVAPLVAMAGALWLALSIAPTTPPPPPEPEAITHDDIDDPDDGGSLTAGISTMGF